MALNVPKVTKAIALIRKGVDQLIALDPDCDLDYEDGDPQDWVMDLEHALENYVEMLEEED